MINVGVVGAGRMGTFHALNVTNCIPGAQVVKLVDTDREACQKLKEKLESSPYFQSRMNKKNEITISTNYHDLFSNDANSVKIDCVIVAVTTTAKDRTPIIVDCLSNSIAVFTEKPLAASVKDGILIRNAVNKSNTLLQIGFMRRFDTDLYNAYNLSKSKLGKPYLLRVVSYDGIIQPAMYYANSGGIFKDMMCHDLDEMYFLISNCYNNQPNNNKIETKTIDINKQGMIKYVSAHGDVNIDKQFSEFNDIDTSVVLLQFNNGALGTIENCRFATYGHDTRGELFGSNGRIDIGPNFNDTCKFADENGYHSSNKLKQHVKRYEYTFELEMQAFIKDVKNNVKKYPSTQAANVNDGIWNLLLIEACQYSKKLNGAAVALPQNLDNLEEWKWTTMSSKL